MKKNLTNTDVSLTGTDHCNFKFSENIQFEKGNFSGFLIKKLNTKVVFWKDFAFLLKILSLLFSK